MQIGPLDRAHKNEPYAWYVRLAALFAGVGAAGLLIHLAPIPEYAKASLSVCLTGASFFLGTEFKANASAKEAQ